jgi:DegV family protein with EDD domain
MSNKIKIITDTGCDIDEVWLKDNNIEVLKFGLNIDEEEYEGETGKELGIEEFYNRLVKGAMPKTNQINPYTAKEHIEPFLKEGYDVFYISFSSGLSGSYASVKSAMEELKETYNNKMYVVDSLCASLGQGLFVDYIVRYMNEGKSFDEMVEYAEGLKLNITHVFTVDDLHHLKRGGRVSGASAMLGTLLGIKPVLHVDNNGKLIALEKVRGRLSSIKRLYRLFEEKKDITDNDPIFISHGNCLEDVMKLKEMIQENHPNNKIYINYIGPIIGSHAGQGTIALFFKGKER